MQNEGKIEIRDLRNGDWYWIHKGVIQGYTQKVGAVGIAVYNFLASLTDRGQGCFPSQKYIAESLGYSRSYINETLKVLEKHGLIRIEKRGRYHRVYHLLKVRCQLYRTQVSTIATLTIISEQEIITISISRVKTFPIEKASEGSNRRPDRNC